MTLSPEDAEDLRQGVRESAKTTISNHLAVIDQWVAERAAEASIPKGWMAGVHEPPMTPSAALRAAASYFAAVNVRMRPSDVEYVVDFLNTYAEQLEGE